MYGCVQSACAQMLERYQWIVFSYHLLRRYSFTQRIPNLKKCVKQSILYVQGFAKVVVAPIIF
jgi:hypothetical protein